MIFQKRYDRARDTQRRARGLDDPEVEARELAQRERKPELEKGDMFAMLFSAFYTIFLPAVGILVAVVLLCCWIFGVL